MVVVTIIRETKGEKWRLFRDEGVLHTEGTTIDISLPIEGYLTLRSFDEGKGHYNMIGSENDILRRQSHIGREGEMLEKCELGIVTIHPIFSTVYGSGILIDRMRELQFDTTLHIIFW